MGADCHWTSLKPVIDGVVSDPVWKQAEVIENFSAHWQNKVIAATKARLLWDEEALYFAAEMKDDHVVVAGKRRQDPIYEGDVFEMFFKPKASQPMYYEIEVNAEANVLELNIPKYPFDFAAVARATPPAIGAAARAYVGGWTVEGKLPWRHFNQSGGRPQPGDEWRFLLGRYDYEQLGKPPTISTNVPLMRPDFHRTAEYLALRFSRP
jgi:hypothetical protein